MSPLVRFRLILLAIAVNTGTATAVAGVFGDGDPANGVEDDRRTVSEGSALPWADSWYRSGGTVVCDGAVRGSATLLASRSDRLPIEGMVIATAAHVLYDLKRLRRWEQCAFHYLGLGALPGHRAVLRRDRMLVGDFDPASDPASPHRGVNDWAFAWLGPAWRPPFGQAGLEPVSAEGIVLGKALLGLLAWHGDAGEISVSAGCGAVFSGPGDLGGGVWASQLLDDCDSGVGASGGGMVVAHGDGPRLVAIRGGQHWDSAAWPAERWPQGPPPGARWDPKRFTNYARAFDDPLLTRLAEWLASLK